VQEKMHLFTYLYFILAISFQQIRTENVTFVPKQIRITVADLPAPNVNESANMFARRIPVPEDPRLFVPDGFSVKLYMDNLTSPRYLIYAPSGDILVSESNANRISRLVDTDKDGYPDERITIADASNGLNYPYGMVFINNFLYVGSRDALRRYLWMDGNQTIEGTGEIIMTYNSNGHRTRTVVTPPAANKIYVGIGSASNVDAEDLPRASIQQANLDGTNQTTLAYGLRNPIGFAFHPVTNDLYVTCQERDRIGDDLVPDYFTRVEQDEFYGWPYAYLSPNLTDPRRCLENGASERPDLVSITKTPDVLFQAHSAVLDMLFYTGTQFPDRYQNGAFAAFHGSWNKNEATGHKVVFIPFNKDTNRPLGYYEDFVYGFLTNASMSLTFGRPVGLLMLKDGSLLFTDDVNNRIYQVQYHHTHNSGRSQSYYASIILLIICSIFIV
jgi:glucose/arabinose dehydrogenase